MSDNFVGELRLFTYPQLVPKGWIPCDGRLLNIKQYAGLYSLLGTAFGGDGQTTFGVPDLRGRVTMGTNTLTQRATKIGTEGVVLETTQVPAHNHTVRGVNSAYGPITPAGALAGNYISEAKQLASPTAAQPFNLYGPPPTTPPAQTNVWAPLDGSTISPVGGGGAHENRQPVLPLQICIAGVGIYPSRN
jgi:microcystin-dependent protein